MVVKKISELTEEEIKKELTKRGFETGGDKAELFGRLRKILVDEAIKKKALLAAANANGTSTASNVEVKTVDTVVPTPSLSKQPQCNELSPPSKEKNVAKVCDTDKIADVKSTVVEVVENTSKSVQSMINASSNLNEAGKIVDSKLKDVAQNKISNVTNPVPVQILESSKLIRIAATSNPNIKVSPKSSIASCVPKVDTKTEHTEIQPIPVSSSISSCVSPEAASIFNKASIANPSEAKSMAISKPTHEAPLNTPTPKLIVNKPVNISQLDSSLDIGRSSVKMTPIIVGNKSTIKTDNLIVSGGEVATKEQTPPKIFANKPVVKINVAKTVNQTLPAKLDSVGKDSSEEAKDTKKRDPQNIAETMNPISSIQNEKAGAQAVLPVRETRATKIITVSAIKDANPSPITQIAKVKPNESLSKPEHKIENPIKNNIVVSVKNNDNTKTNIAVNVNAKSVIASKTDDKTNLNIVVKANVDNKSKTFFKAVNTSQSPKTPSAAVEKVVAQVKGNDSGSKTGHSMQKDFDCAPIMEINAGFDTSIEEDFSQKNDLNAVDLCLINKKPATQATDIKNQEMKEEPLKDKEEKKCLWITGLPKSIKAQDLRIKLNEYGKIISAKIVTSAKNPGSKCFGYVLCEDEKNAQNIIDALNNKELLGSVVNVIFDSNRKLTVGTQIVPTTGNIIAAKSKAEINPGLGLSAANNISAKPEIGAGDAEKDNGGEVKKVPVKNIIPPAHSFWILGFSPTMKAADLKQLYLKYGKVVSAKVILTSPSTPKTKYYGLITMTTEEEVNKCVKETNGILIKGFRISIKKHPVTMSVVDFLASCNAPKEEEIKKSVSKPTPALMTQVRGGFRGARSYVNSSRGRGHYISNASRSSRGGMGIRRGGSDIMRHGRGAHLNNRLNSMGVSSIIKSFNQPHFGQTSHNNGILGSGMGFLQAAHDNMVEERRRQEQSILDYQREQLELEKLKLERERVESERVRVQMMREREEWRMQESGSFKRPATEPAFYQHPSKRRLNVSHQGFFPSNPKKYESYQSTVSVGLNSNNRVPASSWSINRNKVQPGRGRFSNRW